MAIDTERVESTDKVTKEKRDALAHIALVNGKQILINKHFNVNEEKEKITNFRTEVSGVRKEDLVN